VTDRQAAKALHMHMRYEGLNSGPAKSRMRGSTKSLSKRAVCAGPADGDRKRARRERGESEERAKRERGVRAPDRQAVAVKALHPHIRQWARRLRQWARRASPRGVRAPDRQAVAVKAGYPDSDVATAEYAVFIHAQVSLHTRRHARRHARRLAYLHTRAGEHVFIHAQASMSSYTRRRACLHIRAGEHIFIHVQASVSSHARRRACLHTRAGEHVLIRSR
jgi:hypothetical protein